MKFIQIFFIQLFLFVCLISRLLYLQYFDTQHFKKLSENNHIYVRLVPCERGVITDENGVVLADNKPTYKGYIIAYDKDDFYDILLKLKKVMPFDECPVYKRRSYILLYPSLTWEQAALLLSSGVSFLKIEETYKRQYYFEDHFVHVLGYVSPVTQRDDMNIPGLCLGRGCGLESYYNDDIMGELSRVEEEVDACGRFIRTLDIYKGKVGRNIKTTLNSKLQNHMMTYLKNRPDIKSAGIVVMNVHTGAVKAFISYPSFDPNLFVNKISVKDWQALQDNPYYPLYNKVIQGLYSPGSVFKLTVLLTALEKNMVLKSVFCKGHIDVKGARRHCWTWKKGGHGWMNMERALCESCDVYFYELARQIPLHELVKTARKLGFGDITNIDLLYEKNGRLLSMLECMHEDPCHFFIGQGKILATPLQMAQTTAVFVNGGYYVQPHLIMGEQVGKRHLGFQEKNFQILRECMKNVTLNGTAQNAVFYIKNGELGMGGKTGTTQVCKIYKHERDKGIIERKYHLKDHSLFVGYGPVESPEYVVAVVVEHGGSGAVAAGVAKEAMQFLLNGLFGALK